MPELPEVEVTRQRLAPEWVGRRITRVETGPPSYFFLTAPEQLRRQLNGRRATILRRHGKYLLAELDDGSHLLCHLGMTGQLYASSAARAADLLATDPHVHLALFLAGSPRRAVVFRDARKFGKVQWLPPGTRSPRLGRIGPDALTIRSSDLQGALLRRGGAIKTVLLDQSVLAGVGNIYADEALFAAGIHPARAASSLRSDECDELVRALRRVLRAAIRGGGSTISDFLGAEGQPGGYQRNHRVYGQTGLPCPRCGREIARLVLGGRSSHFCSSCQR